MIYYFPLVTVYMIEPSGQSYTGADPGAGKGRGISYRWLWRADSLVS